MDKLQLNYVENDIENDKKNNENEYHTNNC